jgi:hypothetical protein
MSYEVSDHEWAAIRACNCCITRGRLASKTPACSSLPRGLADTHHGHPIGTPLAYYLRILMGSTFDHPRCPVRTPKMDGVEARRSE